MTSAAILVRRKQELTEERDRLRVALAERTGLPVDASIGQLYIDNPPMREAINLLSVQLDCLRLTQVVLNRMDALTTTNGATS